MSRVRDYIFTLNNYSDEEIEKIKLTKCRYLIFGKEIAPTTGTPHLQGYVYFDEKKSMKSVHKMPGWERAALKEAKGNPDQNKTYCSKEGDYCEIGSKPQQGKRIDLDQAYEQIKSGTKLDQIIMENPSLYNYANKSLTKLEDIMLRSNKRTEMTQGEWIYGATGTGKSEYAFQYDDIYVYPYDNGWWDGYQQQSVVIIDEFRGQLPFNELLRMVDKHPNYYVRRRNREPMPFISKKVVVTSSLHPRDLFKNLDANDSLKQLYRRFKIFYVDENGINEQIEHSHYS